MTSTLETVGNCNWGSDISPKSKHDISAKQEISMRYGMTLSGFHVFGSSDLRLLACTVRVL